MSLLLDWQFRRHVDKAADAAIVAGGIVFVGGVIAAGVSAFGRHQRALERRIADAELEHARLDDRVRELMRPNIVPASPAVVEEQQ